MGYIAHNAFIVTGYDEAIVAGAQRVARMIFARSHMEYLVGEIIESKVNGYMTFLIAPDGSKEGWSMSDQGNICRQQFREWLNAQRFSDLSSPLNWAEVLYSNEDEGDYRVIYHT